MAKTIAQALNQVATKSRCPSCGGECDVREAAAWVELQARKTWLKRVA